MPQITSAAKLWHWFLVGAFLGVVHGSAVLHLDHRLLPVSMLLQIFLDVSVSNIDFVRTMERIR